MRARKKHLISAFLYHIKYTHIVYSLAVFLQFYQLQEGKQERKKKKKQKKKKITKVSYTQLFYYLRSLFLFLSSIVVVVIVVVVFILIIIISFHFITCNTKYCFLCSNILSQRNLPCGVYKNNNNWNE